MSKQDYPYPEDEFDALGADRVPQGVHREPTPRWRQWLPYLLVLILVPLLTFVGVKYFADSGSAPPSASPTAPADDTSEEEGAGEEGAGEEDGTGENDGEGAQEEPTAGEDDTAAGEEPGEDPDAEGGDGGTDEEPPADVDHSVHVLVLNGARIQGLAGEVAAALEDDGWMSTEADNYNAAAPVETTLYYTSAEFEAEAQAVADRLGITNLVESASGASNGVVIVLRTDFSMPPG